MFKNEIKFQTIKNAVKCWATNVDGYEGAIGGIYGQIPWSAEMQRVLPWDMIEDQFSEVIPSCPFFSAEKIVCNDTETKDKLDAFANEVATDVCRVYANLIDDLNGKDKPFSAIVSILTDVDEKGFCGYDRYCTFYGDTWKGIIDDLQTFMNRQVKQGWDEQLFFDACYNTIYTGGSVFLGTMANYSVYDGKGVSVKFKR